MISFEQTTFLFCVDTMEDVKKDEQRLQSHLFLAKNQSIERIKPCRFGTERGRNKTKRKREQFFSDFTIQNENVDDEHNNVTHNSCC